MKHEENKEKAGKTKNTDKILAMCACAAGGCFIAAVYCIGHVSGTKYGVKYTCEFIQKMCEEIAK